MKIGLVIDNPRRDLRGMLLLGYKFLKHKQEVYLIPNYHLFESFLLNLDWIILHNCRDMQNKYIRLYNRMGIKIGVLDTEGAQLGPKNKDLKYFGKVVSKNISKIDIYFLWGNLQKKIIENELANLKENQKFKNRLVVSGHPRFELYNKDYRYLYKSIKKNKKIILFNTNFVWNSPRFSQNWEKEMKIGITQYYGNKKIAEEKFKDEIMLKSKFIEIIIKIAIKFNNHKILINPHPFEESSDYKKKVKEIKNIIVLRDVYLPKLLLNSDFVISYNCQTCVDSYLMDISTISINFIDEKKQLSHYFREISMNIESLDDLYKLINDKNYTNVIDKNYIKTLNHIDDLFLINDSSSENIIKNILNLDINNKKNKTLNENLILFFDIFKLRNVGFQSLVLAIIKFFIILISCSNFFYNLKVYFRNNYKQKKYSNTDIKEFYRLICGNKNKIHVKNVYSPKFSFIYKKLSAIKIGWVSNDL